MRHFFSLSLSFLFLLSLLGLSLLMTSCLYTHQQIKQLEKTEKIEGNIHSVQKQVANQDVTFQEVNENLRHINGQFEVIQKNIKDLQDQQQAFQQQLVEVEQKNQKNLRLLEQELESLRRKSSSPSKKRKKASQTGNNKKAGILYRKADQYFKNKRWKQAIMNFASFREASPTKNISFAYASYKMAVSFDKLGMKEDAKTHFEELIRHFPRSKLAEKAKAYLDKK